MIPLSPFIVGALGLCFLAWSGVANGPASKLWLTLLATTAFAAAVFGFVADWP